MVPLSIFLGIPKTDRQDTIRFCIRYQESFTRESGLLFQNRQYFVVDEGSEVSCLSQFGGFFNSKTSNGESRRLAIVFASENFDWTPGAQYIRVLCEYVRVPTTPQSSGWPKGGLALMGICRVARTKSRR
jgi:hypothetical protein